MLYIFRLLLLLINIDQEKVPTASGINYPKNEDIFLGFENGINVEIEKNHFSFSPLFQLSELIGNLRDKIQDGLTLTDIEDCVLLLLLLRFFILAIRYNVKTSFYITCIGLFAGYFWYKHLIDFISMTDRVLWKLPVFYKLKTDTLQVRSLNRQLFYRDLRVEENVSWYNPGQLLYTAFRKGIIQLNPENGLPYYIDPISIVISRLPESLQLKILPVYYDIYQKIIPKFLEIGSKLWNQLSGVAAYVFITRLGKRYCPYLIRWHWTFLLILGLLEQILTQFIHRIYYFQTFVLIPQTKLEEYQGDLSLLVQINLLNSLIILLVFLFISFILFGLFHAICGQYFYFPFLVENTELHVGSRPVNSIYSGGYTAWQNPNEKKKNFPRLWYGWFGRGTTNAFPIYKILLKLFQKFFKIVQKLFPN